MKRVLIIVILFSLIMNPLAKTVQATGAPVIDVAHISTQVVNFFVEAGRWVADHALDTALSIAKKRILDLMVDQTVAWIQGDGNPQFVTDYKAFLNNVGNVVVGDFVQEIGAGRICEPFKIPVQRIIVNTSRPFSEKAACTLNEIVDNVEDFYNDFAQGGWLAYEESLKPQNNIYGAYLLAEEEKDARLLAEVDAANREVESGGGFLSQKRCLFWTAIKIDGEIVTRADGGQNKKPEPLPAPNQSQPWKCTQAEIITPGKTVGDALGTAIQAEFDFVNNTDDISAYTAAIVDALVSRLTREAFRGIANARKPTININDAAVGADNSGCAGLTGRQRELCMSGNTEQNSRDRAKETADREAVGQIDEALRKIDSGINSQSAKMDQLKEANDLLVEKIDQFVESLNILRGNNDDDPNNDFPTLNDAEKTIARQMGSEVENITQRATTNRNDIPTLREKTTVLIEKTTALKEQRANEENPDLQSLLEEITSLNEEYISLKNQFNSINSETSDDTKTIEKYIEKVQEFREA
ncbi:MAG: hypothetical protein Q8L36_02420 [bacterium]|nr:hypothetical protein [bacterium]